MKDIYGADIGTTIPFNRYGNDMDHPAQYPWPAETQVSAGRGVVLSKEPGKSYSTLFMEVYPPGASFIRGEGTTAAECEDSAWKQYLSALSCPGTESMQHEFEPRGYKNGAGFCKHCNTFKSEAFTGEQLGQHCLVCGIGTTYHWQRDDDGEFEFLCREHCSDHRGPIDGQGKHSLEELLDALAEDLDEPDADRPGGSAAGTTTEP